MGKVLKADASLADAFARVDLGSDQPDIWATFPLAFFADALALWLGPSGEGTFAEFDTDVPGLISYTGINDTSGPWQGNWATGTTPAPVAGVWQLCELHFVNDTIEEFFVDGTSVFSGVVSDPEDVRFAQFGLFAANADPASVGYIDYVKLGTTRGSGDIFADDFEDGTLDAWTTTEGDVSVVDAPSFEPAPPPLVTAPPMFFVAFDDPTLEPNPTWTQVG